MAIPGQRALFQPFLPDASERALVWKYSQAVGGRRPRHFHLEPELNVVVSGSAVFGLGDRAVRVSRGELLVFPAGQDHALLDASPDLYLYAIGLDAAFSAKVLGAHLDPVPLHVRLDDADLDAVVERAAALVDRSRAEQAGAELWERAHWLGRRAIPRAARATHVLTRRAMERVGRAPELGLDSVAEEIGAHPSEVSRHFHRDVGLTLVRYRTRLRLLHFIRLLDSRESDMCAAASAAGFGSYSQCHRTFQAELGCAPRQFFSGGVREEMLRTYAP
jgi:AraC-like DNA-binding protein